MPYRERWQAKTPGCLIILIDQSGSMSEVMAPGLFGAGSAKSLAAAMVVNDLLSEIVARCTNLGNVRPRVDIGVIGYGPSVGSAWTGQLKGRELVSITEIAEKKAREQVAKEWEFNPDTGKREEVETLVPIWLEPVAGNGTPMCAALKLAHTWASNWAATHDQNFPPVVVNVTDGAGDGDTVKYSQDIARDVKTSDGAALVFNCHLSHRPGIPVKYPTSEDQVKALVQDPSGQQLALQLFKASSVLPDGMVDVAKAMGLDFVQHGARGFVFGGDISDMTKFITMVSDLGLQQSEQESESDQEYPTEAVLQ